MRWDPSSATYKTNKLKTAKFENIKPEEFLRIIKNFNTVIEGTVIITATRKSNYLHTLLHGESLREFYKLVSYVTGPTKAHLIFIKEGLLGIVFKPMPLSIRSA